VWTYEYIIGITLSTVDLYKTVVSGLGFGKVHAAFVNAIRDQKLPTTCLCAQKIEKNRRKKKYRKYRRVEIIPFRWSVLYEGIGEYDYDDFE